MKSRDWELYFSRKAENSHRLMIWCGVIIFPLFGLLDFLWVSEWKLFLYARLVGAVLLALLLFAHRRFRLSSTAIALLSTHCVCIILMWMMSQLKTTQLFFIYTLNTSTAFIASALFLLWDFRNSIILLLTSIFAFLLFQKLYSPLSVSEIVSYGSLPLLTVAIMSQLYVYFRYQMTRRDYETQEYLNVINQELKDKNVQINRQNNEIQLQKENLEQLNSMKDKLLVIVSHDFRSPLHSLKGVLNLLEDTSMLSPSEISAIAKSLRLQLDHTYNFLENLLLWTKNQMNGASMLLANLPIKSLVDENIGLLEPMAKDKNLKLYNLTDDNHLALADIEMVRLVVRNLIVNAIKYSFAGGEIYIRSERKADEIILSIQDSGLGILQEDQDKLFDNRLPISKIGTGKEKGTGFGLMLCRDFVSKNGGRFWLVSKPGEGSTFYFSLKASLQELVET